MIVTNVGATPLARGDSFKLFNAASYTGAFANVVLPMLPAGLGWNTNSLNVNGTISVIVTGVPVIGAPQISGNGFVFAGIGGVAGANFYLLATTNITQPVSNWTRLLTNQFDISGNFNFTNLMDPAASQDFLPAPDSVIISARQACPLFFSGNICRRIIDKNCMNKNFKHVNYLWNDTEAAKLSGGPARLSLQHPRRGPAHHQHRRRQHLVQDHRRRIRSPAQPTSRCCGSKAPAAICALAGAKTSRRSTRTSCIGLQKLYAARAGQGPEDRRPRTTWSAMYTHTTFNLNPRASSIDTPLHSLHSRQARRSHAPERDHRDRRVSKRCEELTKEIFGGEMALRAVDAPRLRARPRDAGDRREEPEGQGDHDGPARLHLLGRRRQGMLHRDARSASRKPPPTSRRNTQAKGGDATAFGGAKYQSLAAGEAPRRRFAAILPWLRGQVSQQKRFIGTVQDDEKILRFVNSKDAAAPRRTRHELPRPFPAHEDQAALRRLESADRGRSPR